MSRSSSLSGLGRGRARGRRDIAESEQLAERRPGRFRIEDWEGELARTQSDAESKWITMEYNAPSPYPGYTLRAKFYSDILHIQSWQLGHSLHYPYLTRSVTHPARLSVMT